MKLETSNCANYSTRNPKRSAKYVYHTGTSASSTARAGTSCEKEQRRIRNSSSTRWASFPFLTTLKKGRPHGHRYGKKPGDKEYYIAHQLKKKCKKKYFQGTTGFVAKIWHAHGEIWFCTSEFDSADRGTSGVLRSGERRSRGTIGEANMHGSGNSK